MEDNTGLVTEEELDRVIHNKYGSGQVLGLEVQFSKMLGDTIVEQYLKQITEDDMNLIIEYMTKDLFDYKTKHDYSTGEDIVTKIVKEDWEKTKNSGYGWRDTETVISIGSQVKEMFNNRFKDLMKEKIEEILKSDEYQKKVDEVAHDVIDYCVEGYKVDLMNSIREKLIGNVMHNEPYYGGVGLKTLINQAIDNRMHS
jgi:hypothetical protein